MSQHSTTGTIAEKRKTQFVMAAVVAAAVVLGGYGIYGIVRSSNQTQSTATTAQYPQVVAGVSTTAAQSHAFDVHQSRWVTDAKGATYLSVDVTVRNTTQQVQQFSPLLQTRVVDAAGVSHDFTAAVDANPVGGPIPAMSSVEGTLSYRMNQQDTLPTLYFAQEPGAQEIVVSLQ